VVAFAAVAALGAGAAAGAAWLGLVPGVQLRARPAAGAPASGADGPRAATDTPAADSVPAAIDGGADADTGAALDAEALLVAADDSAAGDAIWRGAGRCAGCHGAAGEGVDRLGPNLRDDEWTHGGTRRAIRAVIAEGVAAPNPAYSVRMPAYAGQLDEAQLARLAVFVWTLSRPGAVQPPDSAPAAPASPAPTP
jgi:mono/diheme cytochrome c family protein